VADRVVVMNQGRIQQIGTPEEVYDHPANPFVYHFLGEVNLFHGRIHKGLARIGNIEVQVPEHADILNTAVVGYVRPHDIEIERRHDSSFVLEAVIQRIRVVGPGLYAWN
jgi:sulfate transport system ATP-binding protein